MKKVDPLMMAIACALAAIVAGFTAIILAVSSCLQGQYIKIIIPLNTMYVIYVLVGFCFLCLLLFIILLWKSNREISHITNRRKELSDQKAH